MKRILLLALTLLTAYAGLAQERGYYGYCPMDVDVPDVTAIGTGKNNFMEAAICLDTELDPLVAQLQKSGAKVVGLRFYLTHDYKQRSQQRSLIEMRQGDASAEPVAKKIDNFVQGWNEIMFTEPIALQEGKNYVGYQVYETIGSPYPVATYTHANIPTACCINPAREGFQNYLQRGTLLAQAIIDGTEAISNLKNAALVAFSGVKTMMVQPAKEFPCTLYVRNLSAHPITSVEFKGTDAAGVTTSYSVKLPAALAPYDGTALPYHLIAPSREGMHEALTLSVTKVDGAEALPTMPTSGELYTALDAYERVPLVEEFTSQSCINCPFMSYYLERALQDYKASGKHHIFVAHHSGFAYDRFTKEPDKALTYLFEGNEYNPAVGYDRRVLSDQNTVLQSAKLAEKDPYLTAVTEAGQYPALADVNITPDLTEDGKIGVRVNGSINRYFMEELGDKKVYLSVYFIENDIKPSGSQSGQGPYFQLGLDDEDAPADLAETYRFNGVIRNYYNLDPIGDALTIKAGESYTYDVNYAPQEIPSGVKLENCDLIAFVNIIDKNIIQNNFILNAGSARLQGYTFGEAEGIHSVNENNSKNGNYASHTFDLQGRKIIGTQAAERGLLIKAGRKVIR